MEKYQELESRWSGWNDLDPEGMVACSSGTAALHLAVEAIAPEDCDDCQAPATVLVPDYTMVAVARGVSLASRLAVFGDCDPNTLTLHPSAIPKAHKTEHTHLKMAIAVHTYGNVCDVDRMARLCGKKDILLVEDIAEAHGHSPHPDTAAACWSFYKNKIVAGEEGGAVWFKDAKVAAKARRLRSLGFTEAHDYTHEPYGHNYRMSNAHASLILDSLDRVGDNLEQRWWQWTRYHDEVPEKFRTATPTHPWVYTVRVPGMTHARREEAVRALQKHGVPARFGFRPMTTQEEYEDLETPPTDNPVSYKAWREVFYVGLVPEADRDRVKSWADLLVKVLGYAAA